MCGEQKSGRLLLMDASADWSKQKAVYLSLLYQSVHLYCHNRLVNQMNAKTIKEILAEKLQQIPSVCAAFIHGSAVTGNLRSDSDLDIAILPVQGVRITVQERMAIGGDLESLIGRPVDIGIISTNNLVYAKEVVEHGELLFTRNAFFSECFLSTCLSMYVDLQQDRREVLYAYTA